MSKTEQNLLSQLDGLNAQQLRRLLVEHLTSRKLGLHWESNAIERDEALNADLPLPLPVGDGAPMAGRITERGQGNV